MTTRLKIKLGRFTGVLAVLTIASGIFCRADPPSEPTSECPRFADIRAGYKKPESSKLNDALTRCLANLAKAQEEVCALYTEGKVQKHRSWINGPWVSSIKFTNTAFALVFLKQTESLHQIDKRILDGNTNPSERGYRIEFNEQGSIRLYTGLSPLHIDESLSFYPNGSIERFRADIDRHTSGEVMWNSDGSLQSEGLSPQLPKDAAGLAELEEALRHGDDNTKSEALLAMVRIGPESIPHALNVLKDGDENSREKAAFLFELLGMRAVPGSSSLAQRLREDAIPTLTRRLREDKSPKVRQTIARSLSMGSWAEAAIPALQEAASNDIPEVASAARAALESIRSSSSR